MVSAIARRRSALLKGGASRLTIRVLAMPRGRNSQIASGAWLLISFNRGIVTSYGNVMSTLPATKASSAVERFGMIVHSMPSRKGRPGFQ